MTVETRAAVPLWLLYEEEVDAWRRGAERASRALGSARRISRARSTAWCWCRMRAAGSAWPSADWASGRAHCRSGMPPVSPSACRRAAIVWRNPSAMRKQPRSRLGFAYGAYRFERYRAGRAERAAVLDPPANADMGFVALANEALTLARDLINTPASDLGPAELAAAARALAERHGAEFREWVGEELLAGNFPRHPCGRARQRAGTAPHRDPMDAAGCPGAAGLPRLVLIGKGVCFDSGGLDIKPGSGMALMKKDMGGAAVALALAHMLMGARHSSAAPRPRPGGRKCHQRQRVPARRRAGDAQGAYRRGREHGCRGPARAVRRAGVRGRRAAGSDHRLRHVDGRRARRPGT